MKPPRWLVVCLLAASVMAVLFTLGGWLTWPARTADQFAALVEQGRFDDANDIMSDAHWVRASEETFRLKTGASYNFTYPQEIWQQCIRARRWEPCTWSDLLAGRRFLQVPALIEIRNQHSYPFTVIEFKVERGRLVCQNGWLSVKE